MDVIQTDTFKHIFVDTGISTVITIITWVAFSILIFEFINLLTKNGLYKFIESNKNLQVFLAALVGVIPGCGGPLIITSLFIKDKVSFGALSASFIATFGDAAWFILAVDPVIFLHLMWISIVTGMIVGYILDFSGMSTKIENNITITETKVVDKREKKMLKFNEDVLEKKEKEFLPDWFITLDRITMPLIFFISLIILFPFNWIIIKDIEGSMLERILGIYTLTFVGLFIVYYIFRQTINKLYIDESDRIHYHEPSQNSDGIKLAGTNEDDRMVIFKHSIHDTFINTMYVLIWVFLGILIIEVIFYFGGSGFTNFFEKNSSLWIGLFVGLFIGFLPGCAPQILFAAFCLNGGFSFSALTGNTINQNGDAEFSILASSYKTDYFLKIVNIIPALIVGILFTVLEVNDITLVEIVPIVG